MLSGEHRPLAGHLPKGVDAVDELAVVLIVLGLEQGIELVEINRIEVGQMRTFPIGRPLGIFTEIRRPFSWRLTVWRMPRQGMPLRSGLL